MKPLSVLDAIEIASPCQASWQRMPGDDVVRHCESCRLNVYNLSEMTREAAETLVRSREGRLCVRFYRRPDGTVLTSDCPVGLRAIRRRLARVAASIAALIGGLAFGGLAERKDSAKEDWNSAAVGPLRAFKEWLAPEAFYVVGEMGSRAVPLDADECGGSIDETEFQSVIDSDGSEIR